MAEQTPQSNRRAEILSRCPLIASLLDSSLNQMAWFKDVEAKSAPLTQEIERKLGANVFATNTHTLIVVGDHIGVFDPRVNYKDKRFIAGAIYLAGYEIARCNDTRIVDDDVYKRFSREHAFSSHEAFGWVIICLEAGAKLAESKGEAVAIAKPAQPVQSKDPFADFIGTIEAIDGLANNNPI